MENKSIEAIPENQLSDITATPDFGGDTGTKEVTEKEIFNTSQTANNNETGEIPGSFAASETPGSPNTTLKQTTAPLKAGNFISGEFATGLMDAIMPPLFVSAAGAIGYQVEKKGLQLSAGEKALISPAMQQYLDSINFNFNNPLYNLLFVTAAVYGTKFIEILPTVKKKTAIKKDQEKSKDLATELKQKVEAEKERNEKRQQEKRLLKSLDRTAAIRYLVEKKKLSKAKANEYYNKNIA